MDNYHKIQEKGALGNYFCLNDFKSCSAVNFPKKHADFGGLETNQDMKFRLEFFLKKALFI